MNIMSGRTIDLSKIVPSKSDRSFVTPLADSIIGKIITKANAMAGSNITGAENLFRAEFEKVSMGIDPNDTALFSEENHVYRNQKLNKIADEIVAGKRPELTMINSFGESLRAEMAAAKSILASGATADKKLDANFRLTCAESALREFANKVVRSAFTNMAVGENMYTIAGIKPYQIQETAVQYLNTVRPIYNKLIEMKQTEVSTIPYTKRETFIVYKDDKGVEHKKNVVDAFNDLKFIKEEISGYINKEVVVAIDPATLGAGGSYDLVAEGHYTISDTLHPVMSIKSITVDGTKLVPEKESLSGDAHSYTDSRFSLTLKNPAGTVTATVAGEVDFKNKKMTLLVSAGVTEVEALFKSSNENYERSVGFTEEYTKMPITIDKTFRANITFNPTSAKLFFTLMNVDGIATLVARAHETIQHVKDSEYLSMIFNSRDTLAARFAAINASGLSPEQKKEAIKALRYYEADVDVSYMTGYSPILAPKEKLAQAMNTMYQSFIAKLNPRKGFGMGLIINPVDLAMLTGVTPVIGEQAPDTAVPGQFGSTEISSPVYSFSLDAAGQGGLRAIAVKSDKLFDDAPMTALPMIEDPNMIPFIGYELYSNVFNNNEIRNPDALHMPNIHVENSFGFFPIVPTVAKITTKNFMKPQA
ncbi:MAG: hypothetical protein ACRCX2_34290 [Paraclostridium sp.]